MKFIPSIKLILGVALYFFTLTFSVCQTPEKQIVGYYPNWKYYNRHGMVRPENVDFSKYTIINYSFFKPGANGELLISDSYADRMLLEEKPSLVEYAHIWGTRVMVSIGGWTFSDMFPTIAADPKKRSFFAQECVRLLHQYKFDGIDIDWEYPGYKDHKGGMDDKQNFTLLMKEIRDSIDAYGKRIDYPFLLTAAFGTFDDAMNMIEWDKIKGILDYCNMMTYDFNGTWSEDVNHNSPLYAPSHGLPNSLDWVFKRMTETHGVPPEKLNLGVAFYGRSYLFPKRDAKIYAPNPKMADSITWVEGIPQYYDIVDKKNLYDEFWDDVAQVPYLVKKDKSSLISYDNPKSIGMKAQFMMDKKVAGVIIWELTGDYVEKTPGSAVVGSTPLIEVINEVFKTNKKRQKIKQ
jgi:chitinase